MGVRSLTDARLVLMVAAAPLAFACSALAAEEPAPESREQARLEKVRAEIDGLRRLLDRTEAREGSVIDAIDEIDLRQSLLRRERESIESEIAASILEEQEAAQETESL